MKELKMHSNVLLKHIIVFRILIKREFMINMEQKDQKHNVSITIKIKMDIIMNNVMVMTLLMYKYNNKD